MAQSQTPQSPSAPTQNYQAILTSLQDAVKAISALTQTVTAALTNIVSS